MQLKESASFRFYKGIRVTLRRARPKLHVFHCLMFLRICPTKKSLLQSIYPLLQLPIFLLQFTDFHSQPLDLILQLIKTVWIYVRRRLFVQILKQEGQTKNNHYRHKDEQPASSRRLVLRSRPHALQGFPRRLFFHRVSPVLYTPYPFGFIIPYLFRK